MTHDDLWIETSDGRLFARRWPGAPAPAGAAGSPVVLLHDSLGSVALWRDFPARLAAATGRAVVAYDRLGFGRSDVRCGPMPTSFVADEATTAFAALRAQLGIERFAVVGHSVGGGMAVHVAAAHPDACEAVVTIAAQAFVEPCTLAGVRAEGERFARPGAVERLAKYHGDKARWVLSAWVDTWLDPRFAGWSLADALPRVRCPLLALHGERDEYGTPAHAEAIARGAGGPSRCVLLPGVGHVPQRERPEDVLAWLAGFLAAPAAA